MSQKKPFSSQKMFLYGAIILLIAYFFTKNSLDFSQLSHIKWSGKLITAILFAISMLILRDLGYVLRLRLLTEGKLTIRQCIRIILLWEFGSAITPGMIGGKAVAVFLLVKYKIRVAHASSMVLLAILLDEFIFICLFPIFYLIIGSKMLHGDTSCPDWIVLSTKIPILKNISYLENMIFVMLSIIICFVVIAFIGIFIYPKWIQNLILKLSKIGLLNRWQSNIKDFAEEIYQTSVHIRSKNRAFWTKIIFYTLISWVGRYLIGVAIVWGLSNDSFDLFTVYAKQYALWLIFYLPSTPGSSGIAEALYMAFYCSYIETGLSGAAAFIWRFLSYYIYLFIGFGLLFTSNKSENLIEE